MKLYKLKHILFIPCLLVMLVFSSCELEEVVDPNGVSVGFLNQNLSEQGVVELSTGVLEQMRRGYGTYLSSVGSVGRECYRFDADPRNTQDLLGVNGMSLDNNTFYLTAPYNSFYSTVKNANLLLEALDNTSSISDAEKEGCRGFAKTVKAFQLSLALNMLHDNGIRIDVADPDNLGAFVDRATAYTQIRSLLDEGIGHLNNAGSEFVFTLPGFEGFDTPATFAQVNRAIAARIAIYQENWAEVLTLLNSSFIDEAGSLDAGPNHAYSNAGGDFCKSYLLPGR